MALSGEVNSLNAVIRETAMLSDRAKLSTCLLMVFIEGATSLPNVKKTASEPFPYCVATVGKDSYTTIVVKKTYDPCWESQHSFLIQDVKSDTMRYEIFDQKTTKKLGWAEVPVRNLLEQKNMEMSGMFRLQNSGPSSELRLNMRLRILQAISLTEAASSAQKIEVNPAAAAKLVNAPSTVKERTPPHVGGAVSAQEFKENAVDMPQYLQAAVANNGDQRIPVDLEAESDLRQRAGKSAAIHLTLRWGESSRTLNVSVHEVQNLTKLLPNNQAGNAHYVSITSSPFKTKRRTKDFLGNPDHLSYEETLDFPIDNEQLLRTACLVVNIKEKSGLLAKEAVAQTIVSLEPVIGVNSHTEWYVLGEPDHK